MGKVISAFTNDVLGNMDAVGISEAIAKGSISASEASEAAIERAEKVNCELNAIVLKTYDKARANVSNLKQGLLSGVPTFIKDNEMLEGTPTQMGTLAFAAKTAKRNSKFVNQFLSTGLISLGKSTLPEFGLICSTENPNWGITRNPWNTDYTTGGSSSGSAALVASGVVPIALANDGAGSTRIPASCCGLVGLKPSLNRLLNFERSEILPVNIGYEGVLTRTVRDTAAFYAAAEKYFHHKSLPKIGLVQNSSKQRLKILFFDNIRPGKLGHQDEDTYHTLISTSKLLESMGHRVEQQVFPFDIDDLSYHFLNYYGFFAYIYTHFNRFIFKSSVNKKLLENFTTGLSNQFKRNILSLPKSLKLLKTWGLVVKSQFKNYDVILTPVVAHEVPKIGYFDIELPYKEVSRRAVTFAPFTGLQNITGDPAISLPLGVSQNGLPIGMQFSAAFGYEKRLLELAYELEAALPWKGIEFILQK